jgi:hypothetical protein
MKKSFVAVLALSASSALFSAAAGAEEVRLVNADGSSLSELCIAAVESETRFREIMQELGMVAGQEYEVSCNGRSLKRFAADVRAKREGAQPVFVFRAEDESPISQLCMAALESDAAYEQTRARLRTQIGVLESEVLCNDMPVKAFARKYRNMTAGL